MSDHKKTRGVTLRSPADLQRILATVISDIFRAGQQIEHSGKIFQLGSVWLKAFEITKLEEIEKRLNDLEADKK